VSRRANGQIRRSQAISTWGPGALLDLPHHAVIVGGLDSWPRIAHLEEVHEQRLARKIQQITGVAAPRLYAPPAATNNPADTPRGIGVWRFPEWFLVQEVAATEERERSRRIVHRRALDERRRFEGLTVVPTRFVKACPKGHVSDLDWRQFVHGPHDGCTRQLWLDERGTSGDLIDLVVRCACGKSRSLHEATAIEARPLGTCTGDRPWLGTNASEPCNQPARLLIRTASNAYFAQVLSVLSLPDRGSALQTVVGELWDDLQIVQTAGELAFVKRKPRVAELLAPFDDADVLAAIHERRTGRAIERDIKQVELDSILAAPEGYGEDVPIDPDFHARRLPDRVWRRTDLSRGIEAVIQLHRLREVRALLGFTRFDAVTPDIHGEYDEDVERAQLALEPQWFPAVENRGEGIFVQLHAGAVRAWLERPEVEVRIDRLLDGHERWKQGHRSRTGRPFPGGPYVLLHTLSHLLIQCVAMRCGYPASSIRERVYADEPGNRYGLLLYTGSPDAEGTLGGLVQEARHLEAHLAQALRLASLCSYDPVCAHHTPGASIEQRWLHGAACHGCTLIAEPSCEMRNDYLDRALVVPILGATEAAFFDTPHD